MIGRLRDTVQTVIEYLGAGRWIAEVPEQPDVLAHSAFQEEAMTKAETLALRVLAKYNFAVLQKRQNQM
jgi:predicted RNase H-like HicB family nuclease